MLFRDHDKLKGKNALVQRVQPSGVCFMHAPVVMQHYLVTMEAEIEPNQTSPGLD